MSSRMRKKRNQRANNVMSRKTVASLLKVAHVNGCMYGVHTFEYKDHGNDIWLKTCIAHPYDDSRVCGATYQVFGAELEWIKEQQNGPIQKQRGYYEDTTNPPASSSGDSG